MAFGKRTGGVRFKDLSLAAGDQDLIVKVARIIDPGMVVDKASTAINLEINETNRQRAADIAIDVIRCVREHGPNRGSRRKA